MTGKPQPIWCDPPPQRPGGIWRVTLEPVTAQPGRWALVRTYRRHPSAVDAVRKLRQAVEGKGNVMIPPGRWEFVQRQVEPDTPEWGVWARYVDADA